MTFLPGRFREAMNYYDLTKTESAIYISADYLVILMYIVLVLLALRNIWAILVKQKEYKNLPIFAFYAFSIIALSLRLIYLIGYWTGNPIFRNIDWVQQGAKLCVGVVQDWITLELAIRIHHAKGYSDISEAAKSKLRYISGVLFATITMVFVALSITVIVSASKHRNSGFAFKFNMCFVN